MKRVFSFLYRNPSSGILYFRAVIPERYRPFFGKREIRKSLGIRDKVIAMPVALQLYSELQQEYQAIDIQRTMAKDNPRQAKIKLAEQALKAEQALNRINTPDNGFGYITFGEVDLPGGGKAKNVEIDTGDAAKDLEIAQQLLSGQPSREPATRKELVNSDSIKLADCARAYRAEKIREGSWTDKTASEHESLHDLVARILGNRYLETYTHADGRKFKETLLQLPANMTKGVYAGKTIRQILAMDPKPMAPRTVNEKLQRVSSLFDWAIRQGYCQINPFQGLKLSIKRKASSEREAFTPADLQSIFNPECFTLDKLRHDWQYWLPILALYTGARAQELCQLRVQDLFEENGVYGLNITPDAGKLKNLSAERVVPLHRAVVERGFLDHVKQQRSAGCELLFPQVHDKKIKASDKLGRWFNRAHLTKVGLKPTDRKISFHSLRHTFITQLKKMDIPEAKAAALAGHAHNSITYDRYGKSFDLSALAEVIEQVDFDLTHLQS